MWCYGTMRHERDFLLNSSSWSRQCNQQSKIWSSCLAKPRCPHGLHCATFHHAYAANACSNVPSSSRQLRELFSTEMNSIFNLHSLQNRTRNPPDMKEFQTASFPHNEEARKGRTGEINYIPHPSAPCAVYRDQVWNVRHPVQGLSVIGWAPAT